VNTAGTYYYHTDHLQSSTVITDSTGVNVEDMFYYPYGEMKYHAGSVNVKHKFSGHEYDGESGLYYMGARYYDPRLARFITPDPVVPMRVDQHNFLSFKVIQDLTNPQKLNRYSYCANNPIVFRDPFGLDRVSSILGFVSYGLNTSGLALGPGVKAAGVFVSFVAIGYSGAQMALGNMSRAEAVTNMGLAAGDIAGFTLEKAGFEVAGALVGGLFRGGGVANTSVDAVRTFSGNESSPGQNTNSVKSNQPPIEQPPANPEPVPQIVAPPVINSQPVNAGAATPTISQSPSPSDSTSHQVTETPSVSITYVRPSSGSSTITNSGGQTTVTVTSSGGSYVSSSGNVYVGGDFGA